MVMKSKGIKFLPKNANKSHSGLVIRGQIAQNWYEFIEEFPWLEEIPLAYMDFVVKDWNWKSLMFVVLFGKQKKS